MTYEEETRKVECLFEAICPDLYPTTYPCLQSHTRFSQALKESGRCRSLADAFTKHVSGIRESLAKAESDEKELAVRLFIEVASSTDLWEEALVLIRSCENWRAAEPARRSRQVSSP